MDRAIAALACGIVVAMIVAVIGLVGWLVVHAFNWWALLACVSIGAGVSVWATIWSTRQDAHYWANHPSRGEQ